MLFGNSPFGATPFASPFGLQATGISGTLAVQEVGDDTASMFGANGVGGALAAVEEGDDTFSGAGYQPAFGFVYAEEAGDDLFTGNARLLAVARFEAFESGEDLFVASGYSVISGMMFAREDDDIFEGLLKVPAFRMTGGTARGVISGAGGRTRYAESRR